MFCKDGTGADSETCTEESLECPNDDDDVCTKVLTSKSRFIPEDFSRSILASSIR